MPNDEYPEFKERFAKMSDNELIDTYNKGKNNPGWVRARMFFQYYLREEFIKRKIVLPK